MSADAMEADAAIAASARVAALNMVCSFSARLGWFGCAHSFWAFVCLQRVAAFR
jgi:hypothetical protein